MSEMYQMFKDSTNRNNQALDLAKMSQNVKNTVWG